MDQSYEPIPLEKFSKTFGGYIELSSVALEAYVVSVSDEFFAKAENLLQVEPAPSLKGQYGPNGALYSGWESRRHNPTYDWCIIKLGATGTIVGFDVDTSHFNGNEAPEVSVDAIHGAPTERPSMDDPRWTEILPKVLLGPNSRHLFKILETEKATFVRLNMYPDGGIARFRVYGNVSAVYPADVKQSFDLAHVFAGGHVEFTSDQHFGVGLNLILPGSGKDMSDGWETKRSRQADHKDWAIIKLGAPGVLEHTIIDTAHFKGNFPEGCEIHALFTPNVIDWQSQGGQEQEWTLILPRTKLGPHCQHHLKLINVVNQVYTHIKVTIYPDGGIKRVRVIGHRIARDDTSDSAEMARTNVDIVSGTTTTDGNSASKNVSEASDITSIPVRALTPEAFAPYGKVLQAYSDHAAAPKGVRITPANGGTASKFHKLSLLHSTYPEGVGATTGISVYRCKSVEGIAEDGTIPLEVLERHPFTNQAFVPMGRGEGEESIADPADKYLVVVAENGPDDRPDIQTLRAFVATAGQGVVYGAGIWHQPMTVLGKPLDLACVETQIGDGSPADCEILKLDTAEMEGVWGKFRVRQPEFFVLLTLMESRKRAHSHEDEPAATKKRIVAAANGSPHVNGTSVEPEELDLGRNLESFRKEAIYRRMKHYCRENERNLARITELERRKNTCEAGLAAISACWSQLVGAIRLLVEPEDLSGTSIGAQDIFDLTVYLRSEETTDIASAIGRDFDATRSLVTRFIQMSGAAATTEVYADNQKAQTECAALRSELDLLRARLKDSQALKEQYHTLLVVAENRIERAQSSTVMEMERGRTTKYDESEESQRKPSSPAPVSQSPAPADVTNGSVDAEVLQELVNIRDAKIRELEKEGALLRDQIQLKDIQLKSPALEQVIEHSAYKILQERENALRDTLATYEEKVTRLTDEVNVLQISRKEWEESSLAASSQSFHELRTMMSKRDVDNARLREQREQLNAEILERKQKESVKQASMQEYKTLAESRSERVAVLESEVKRLKSRLAAEVRDEDLMKFIFTEGGDPASSAYVDALKNRAIDAENRAAALEQALAGFQADGPDIMKHVKSEAEVRQKLSEVVAQLEGFQRVYGDSSLPPDLSRLSKQLKQKDDELQQLRLIKDQQTQAEALLYVELEKLSTSWEALDRQVKSKVFDLSQLEDRLIKMGLDKAKSDNKFFAVMRDKEAIDVERKNLSRNVERQAKVLERLHESERNLQNQIVDAEKEIIALKRGYELLKQDNQKLVTETNEAKMQAEHERREKANVRTSVNERESNLSAMSAKLRAVEDGLMRAKKEVEQQAQEWKRIAASNTQNKDGEVQNLKELLRCSTCKTNFRNTVITKCMHTFCKQCVEARITTRQRKCPACNLVFAQSEVQTLWFQ
ncbi:hypothetical protein AX15_003682 [Amanita polypyramis BW_CC]|nr:hypothetical protein AX15_003682 [Amanita polypyramis BW_CC]